MPIVGLLLVLPGLAIRQPVQLGALTPTCGGYVWSRSWHFVATWLLVLLSVVHVFMVLAVDPYSIRAMVTGRYKDSWSPETRNARPFVHLLPGRDSATGVDRQPGPS